MIALYMLYFMLVVCVLLVLANQDWKGMYENVKFYFTNIDLAVTRKYSPQPLCLDDYVRYRKIYKHKALSYDQVKSCQFVNCPSGIVRFVDSWGKEVH